MVETTINLDGDTIKLKFPNSAVRKIDRALGYPAMSILEKAEIHGSSGAFTLDGIATVLWGGMLHLQDGRTIDQVADMIPLRMEEYMKVAEKTLNIICEIYGLDDADVEVNDQGKGKKPGKKKT